MNEIWKKIPGFDGCYEVSNLGRVRSVDRRITVANRWGGLTDRLFRGRVLQPATNHARGGYRYVNLHDSEGQHLRRVAGLVAAAFLGPRPEGMQVCHNDGNPANDNAQNLRYGTPAENQADKDAHGTTARGARHPQARLTETQIDAIRRSVSSSADLARHYGVSRKHINSIRAGRRWAA